MKIAIEKGYRKNSIAFSTMTCLLFTTFTAFRPIVIRTTFDSCLGGRIVRSWTFPHNYTPPFKALIVSHSVTSHSDKPNIMRLPSILGHVASRDTTRCTTLAFISLLLNANTHRCSDCTGQHDCQDQLECALRLNSKT